MVEQLKGYVESGITTIIVPGSQPATIELYGLTRTAICEAIYRLSGSDYYDKNSPYNGKIDLILQDVTEQNFQSPSSAGCNCFASQMLILVASVLQTDEQRYQ